jgi:hypothetical protein
MGLSKVQESAPAPRGGRVASRFVPDSPLERAGFEPSVPGESGFDFAREVRGRLFAGGRRIRTPGPSSIAPLAMEMPQEAKRIVEWPPSSWLKKSE